MPRPEIQIYPTIFSKELKIVIRPVDSIDPLTLRLYDSSGKLVQEIFTGKIQGQKTLIFKIQNRLKPRIYFIIRKMGKQKLPGKSDLFKEIMFLYFANRLGLNNVMEFLSKRHVGS